MRQRKDRYGIGRVLSILFAMVLEMIPLPPGLDVIWPEWVWLVLVVWMMLLPEYLSLVVVWCLGFVMDLLQAAPLGMHAFSFTCIAYLIRRWHRQIHCFPLCQQAIFVGFLALLNLGLNSLIFYSLNGLFSWHWVFSALVNALLWPFIFCLFRRWL